MAGPGRRHGSPVGRSRLGPGRRRSPFVFGSRGRPGCRSDRAKGGQNAIASGGVFNGAQVTLFGKMKIKDLADFYKSQLAGAWDINDEDVATGYLQNNYINKKDQGLTIYINAEEADLGTTVDIELEKS